MFFPLPSSDKPHYVDSGGIILTMRGILIEDRDDQDGFMTHRYLLQEDIMGAYRNSRPFNVIAWSTCVTIMVLTALLLRSFLPEYAS